MQISLTQPDIEAAVRNYIGHMGIDAPIGDVTFTATRGESGITATVEIGRARASAPAPRLVETAEAEDAVADEESVADDDEDGSVSIFG